MYYDETVAPACCFIIPSGSNICSFSLPDSFVNGPWSAHADHVSSAWNVIISSLTCTEDVPLKHQIPLNTSLYPACIFDVCFCSHLSVGFCGWPCNKSNLLPD